MITPNRDNPLAIPPGHKKNFETLKTAAIQRRLALMSVTRKADGKQVSMICCVNPVVGVDGKINPDDGYDLVPLAAMLDDDNPFEAYIPPD